jgi:hypothetical protein
LRAYTSRLLLPSPGRRSGAPRGKGIPLRSGLPTGEGTGRLPAAAAKLPAAKSPLLTWAKTGARPGRLRRSIRVGSEIASRRAESGAGALTIHHRARPQQPRQWT